MAELISPYSSSYEKLSTLFMTARAYSSGPKTFTLPERPSGSDTDSNRYTNAAISMLSDSSAYLYDDRHYLDSRLDEFGRKIDKVDKKVDNHFKYTQKQFTIIQDDIKDFRRGVKRSFDIVDDDIKAVKDDIKAVKDGLGAFKDEVRVEFKVVKDDLGAFKDEVRAEFKVVKDDIQSSKKDITSMARNRLVTRLNFPIEKVRAPIQDETGVLREEVAPDFPLTVRRFWRLASNSKLNNFVYAH